MQSTTITVEAFAEALGLSIKDVGRGHMVISESEINRPGLQLTGYFQHFAYDRVQLIGNAETYYLMQLSREEMQNRVGILMQYDVPCVVFARDHEPPDIFLREAKARQIPIFSSPRPTTKVSHSITNLLDRMLAPSITRHGVLLDVYGVGVMLIGESGMGKSETALEMVKRGHRLVADDVVEIRRVADNRLSGTAPSLTRYLLEIRGIGIIDVRYMYGVGAVIQEKSIDIVMEMEMWEDGKAYDRLGIDDQNITILDVELPHILMPVRPGRNLAIIVEVAARNYRLKKLGYDAAKEFDKRWMEELENM